MNNLSDLRQKIGRVDITDHNQACNTLMNVIVDTLEYIDDRIDKLKKSNTNKDE